MIPEAVDSHVKTSIDETTAEGRTIMTFWGRRSSLALIPLCLLLQATSAQGAVLINNGLAPPNPDNIFDDATHESELISVQNVGCNWEIEDPCSAPGAPTTIQVLDGADIRTIEPHETSSIWMDGGRVSNRIHTWNGSELTMTAGIVSLGVIAFDTSTINLSGGWVRSVRAAHDSTLIMTGGTLAGGGFAEHAATFELSGGSVGVGGNLNAYDSAVISIVGSDFSVDGFPVPYGDIAAPTGTLTGTLASGDAIDVTFNHAGAGRGTYDGTIRLVAVPEPARWLQLSTGLGCLLALRGTSRRSPSTPSTRSSPRSRPVRRRPRAAGFSR